MELYHPPKPALWTPPKPGIIRQQQRIRTPAEECGLKLALLPGFMSSMAMSGEPEPPGPSLSVVSTSHAEGYAGTATIPYPIGNAVGDLLVLYCALGGSVTTPTPAGFSVGATGGAAIAGSGNLSGGFFYRVSNGTETGTYSPGGGQTFLIMWRVRRSPGPITTVTVFSPAASFVSGDPVLQTLNVGSNTTPLIMFGGANQSGTTVPTGTLVTTGTYFEVYEGDIPGFAFYYAVQNSSPTSLTFDIPDSGSFNSLISVGFKPNL